jgi:hypothetical protein
VLDEKKNGGEAMKLRELGLFEKKITFKYYFNISDYAVLFSS